jgi:DNA polymerase I-like protein with 3'-5' exonuclease and polymerase domains
MEAEGDGRLLRGLRGLSQVRPRVLITAQVSGRWSTTNPNLPGRPHSIKGGEHDIIVPDWGTFWLSFDHEAVETWLAAIYSGERRDLDPLEAGEDVHLATARDMFPDRELTKQSPERQQAKTTRYNLQFAYDYRGILDSKDLHLFGGREAALTFAKKFLDSRPLLQAAKARVFAEAWRTRLARSAFGRVRRLTGDERAVGKDAWSQVIQGTVSGIMNRLLLRLLALSDGARLILNEHDGATLSFPNTLTPEEVLARCHALASEPWTLWGRRVSLPTQWKMIVPPESVVD